MLTERVVPRKVPVTEIVELSDTRSVWNWNEVVV
jgi:hypothetical protein